MTRTINLAQNNTMRIVIFGANGKTGRLIVKQALEAGHRVWAFMRNSSSFSIIHPNLNIIVGELNETLKLRDLLSDKDVCISALGGKSLTKVSTNFTNGIENVISVMKEKTVKKFLYISSLGAGESRIMFQQPFRFIILNVLLRVPIIEHNKNEQILMSSNLDWTIIRPASLTNEPKTQTFKHGIDKNKLAGNPKISRASVASFIISQLTDPTYTHKCVWLHD